VSRRIAFIGLGVMGRAMAAHLATSNEVVGYDPDPNAQATVPRAASAREAAKDAEIVVTMLPNGRIVREVVEDVAEILAPGSLLIDTSSSEPWLTRDTGEVLAARGVRMIDAPVSGAEWGAKAAELVFMCGGSDEDIAAARPILELMGRAIFHVGPLSAGHAMKTINNVITAGTAVVTAEAMEIGKAYDLDPKAMVDVLEVSTGGSWWSTERIRQDILNGAYADGFKLGLMLKDVEIAGSLAERLDLVTPLLAGNRETWRAAAAELGADSPITAIARHVEKAARKK